MTRRLRGLNGVEHHGDGVTGDEGVVRSPVSGRFVISAAQAKKLEALQAEARKPTSLPHGF